VFCQRRILNNFGVSSAVIGGGMITSVRLSKWANSACGSVVLPLVLGSFAETQKLCREKGHKGN
jgi:hypothetical protein